MRLSLVVSHDTGNQRGDVEAPEGERPGQRLWRR
jgi:hypothetical protein